MKSLTVVIPTLNEERYIGCLLSALARQTVKPMQTIVVDGQSADGTVSVARSFEGVEALEAERGVGRQRQAGLCAARGDMVMFLDADTLPPPDFIERMLSAMDRRRLRAACPWFLPADSGPIVQAVYVVFDAIFTLLQRVLASGAGTCIVVDRELAVTAGGFRADLVYEDIEFIRRVSKRGRFGIVNVVLPVSGRRFRAYGTLRTFLKYAALSFFFTFGLFAAAERTEYQFAYDGANDETVELVGEDGQSLGAMPKREAHHGSTPLHRGFSVFVFDRHGRVLLQRRSAGKVTWPLVWSNSCCGHPAPGERLDEAARRRVREELGMRVRGLRVALPNFRYRAELNGVVENELCPVIVAEAGSRVRPNPYEVAETEWVEWDDLIARAKTDPESLSPWCVQEARLLDTSDEFRRFLEERLGRNTPTP